jgi:hypothetical protein
MDKSPFLMDKSSISMAIVNSYVSHRVHWLVVWNMNGLFFHSVGNVIIPSDELIFFRGLETTNQQCSSCLMKFQSS